MTEQTTTELPNVAEFWSLGTHNGMLTVESARTGDHRTFRIQTQADDAKFMPGVRLVSLLSGPDIPCEPRIVLWKSKRGGVYEQYAALLENWRAHVEAGRINVLLEGSCRRCNRALTVPESVRDGIGPTCREKE